MASDALRLFDLALAERLLALDATALLAWLDANLDGLKATTRRGAAAWLDVMRRTLPAELAGALPPLEAFELHWDDLRVQLVDATTPEEAASLVVAIAEKAAFGEERIELDVGEAVTGRCRAAPLEGALSSLALFRTGGPERYRLLLPEQVDRLLAAAAGDLAEPGRARLAALRDRCAAEPGLRVAYLFDL
ncbi:MAG TPA: hypothetical protein VFP50_19835 [Anaeromyxobacteraceae bacterium]|nr:hypothetical protein [Anaeromyxobacteraceae bacterium]